MADEIQAPWTPEQIRAINSYQTAAEHPLICSRTRDIHQGWHVVLIARRDGMRCSDPSCNYRQNWALGHMAAPREG
ncbi:hypothetical protein [Kitasatospora sp. NBC_01302]|uniref:hypothetical protein n=1 Tax=Kitasatospora sp. NBC_01302 TaxID=2903575 RepID=UPI002E0E6B60|nr:hypothetical protein OG294_13920 [Kitasatospora sp. NBC_01302]